MIEKDQGIRELVIKAASDGIARSSMPEAIERQRNYTHKAYWRLVNSGVLPRPTSEEITRVRRESISRARGGIFLLIEPYANMGMTAGETVEALRFEHGKELKVEQVRSALSKSREKNTVRKLTDEEKRDSLRNTYKDAIEIKETARLWVGARSLTQEIGVDTSSWTRLDWKEIIGSREMGEAIKKKQEEIERKVAEELNRPLAVRGMSRKEIEAFMNQDDSELGPEDKNTLVFARELVNGGFITENTNIWEIAKAILKDSSATQRLGLEGYIKARIKEIRGDKSYMDKYNELGESIDPKWFYGVKMTKNRQIARNTIILLSNTLSK